MIQPIKNRVIVQADAPPAESCGFVLLEKFQKKETTGTVVSLGKDADNTLKIGSRVAFGERDGLDMDPKYCDNLERCVLLSSDHIKCVIN